MLPNTIKLHLPKLIVAAKRLPLKGVTCLTENKLFCLDVNDDFIHQLFPYLEIEGIKKPNYFGEKAVGAHITIVYPEETQRINLQTLHQEHSFSIKDVVSAQIGRKIYYVVLVESDSLLKLRRELGLADLLNFKGYEIGFHITIAVKNL